MNVPPGDVRLRARTNRGLTRADVTGVVLCGGGSRRMGQDKARLELAGQTLLERATESLDPLCVRTLVACGPVARYDDLDKGLGTAPETDVEGLGPRIVLDEYEDGGPLAGLAAGLAAAETEWILLLPCDMPGVGGEPLQTLLREAVASGADVTVLRGEHGPVPTCGVYRRDCLAAVRAALEVGKRRMISFWTAPGIVVRQIGIGACGLAPRALREGDPLLNVNTPADWGRARVQLALGQPALGEG